MAYTTIKKPSDYFNTVLYTGNGSTQSITGVGFTQDFTWIKIRSEVNHHRFLDTVRGATKELYSDLTSQEVTGVNGLTSFNSDGFTLGTDHGFNKSSATYASWNWLGAGTAPSKTYTVKVVDDGGNKYRFDDFGTSAVTLEISEGGTYTFDQADSSNSGHPLRFSTTSDGTHGGGSEYTTGVTTVGTPGSAGAYTEITVAASAPTLYYYCSVHSGMGGQANTPTTNSFSSFDGSIQSNISPNTTSGFSIVSYTGNGVTGATVGHGLGTAPAMVIVKERGSDTGGGWRVWHKAFGTAGNTDYIFLNQSVSKGYYGADNSWNSVVPTSSIFSLGSTSAVNGNTQTFIAYVFADVQGYSKFGSYTGNGNADGTFVYTGFKPAFVMIKDTAGANSWEIRDTTRHTINDDTRKVLRADTSGAESVDSSTGVDILSNGFKPRYSGSSVNGNGTTYIYMAFAEQPLVGDNPATAR